MLNKSKRRTNMTSIINNNYLKFALLFKFVISAGSADMSQRNLKNLCTLKWAHAVNSQQLLNEALKGDIDLIEADIVLGKLNNSGMDLPIMAHPPAKNSDLSLHSFLSQINAFNDLRTDNMKGVKLDFKSIEVFEESLQILREALANVTYNVWLNADILKGPVNNTDTKPVEPKRFLNGCKQFSNVALSIGWTTKWSSHSMDGSYSLPYINAMIDVLKENNILETGHSITFPVRAGIAANSLNELQELFKAVENTNNATLTLWSSADDYVDINKLQQLIGHFGFNRIYVDVPKALKDQLILKI